MNRKNVFSILAILAIAIVSAACGGGGGAASNLKEIQKQNAGDYVVTLLSESGQLKNGNNQFVIEVRNSSDNQLVDVGEIQSASTMPMPGMPNMIGETSVTKTATAGRYNATASFSMAGKWNATLTFANGQKVQLALRAQ